MKDFMFIFRNGIESRRNAAPEEMQNNMQLWFAWVEKLKSQGVYAGGEALMPGGKTITGEKQVITDGPFAESKELVGGYFIVKAEDLDSAVAYTKDYPDFSIGGSVEVREVVIFE
ncbi:hypothetical protein I5907_01335 [Panacibacter sp. DH6]|uniref:YCII-related domain-containing protein n=1 Tax=Panacibacter microcysteis TaxID=2793269 RepID=A0A931GY79_9BACT|nr:YciI family protein [Panacibacter microcysteis]MBG9374862.1 hypothetical protein [Panacibacter microcysteis]